MPLAIQYPSWLDPVIIPGLPFRWYGLMYIFAFVTAYFVFRRQVKERNFPLDEDQLSGLFFWSIISLILGARIFFALVYDRSNNYLLRPWMIFWPFHNGQFTGFHGMSYHGGVIGGVLAMIIYSRVKKFDVREILDMFAASIPLGYTFGRLGNFINGELFGRVTTGPLGMFFDPDKHSSVRLFSASEEWVREVADKTGAVIKNGLVNLPRHPSQLYEMVLEGIVLWAFIWFFRNRKPFKGFLVTLYLSGYGFVRFIIEYFREPDSQMGYPINFASTASSPTALYHPLLSFSTGQILCFLMILTGIAWALIAARMPNREPVRIYPTVEEIRAVDKDERDARRKQERKMRKKLK